MSFSSHYLFYDLETTGLQRAFDQIIQFAAIETDADFREIKTHDFLIRLNPDVVPSLEAMMTHGISPSKIQTGLGEGDAIRQIHHLLNQPNTINLGYNTLGFDDEMLRFSFYRNLLPPYSHQYANGCFRADIFTMTTLYALFHPDLMEWPIKDGKLSLKLEKLNEANGFHNGTAHQALDDVIVTLALAKKLFEKKETWYYLLDYFNKNIDLDRQQRLEPVDSLPNLHRFGLLVDPSFGSQCQYIAPVLSLGNHQHYSNQTLWLRLDLPHLAETTLDTVSETPWVIFKKLSEPGFILQAKPRYLSKINNERQSIVSSNLKWLKENNDILEAITAYYRNYTYPVIENVDVDARLYLDPFPNDIQKMWGFQFNKGSFNDKVTLLSSAPSSSYYERALRFLGRNNEGMLPDSPQENFLEYVKAAQQGLVGTDHRGEKHRSISEVLKALQEKLQEPTFPMEKVQSLLDLKTYLEKVAIV